MESNIRKYLDWVVVVLVILVVTFLYYQQQGRGTSEDSLMKESSLLAEVSEIGISHFGIQAGVQRLRAVVNNETKYLKEEKDDSGKKSLVPVDFSNIEVGDLALIYYEVNTKEGFSFEDRGLAVKEIQVLMKSSF